MRRPALLLLAILPACSYSAFTPPTRPMPLETAAAPGADQTDLQLEASRVGTPLGFDTTNGGGRLRRGLTSVTALTVDAGVLHVNGDSHGTNPLAYTGRVGLTVHDRGRGDGHLAFTTGVGVGVSPVAGHWNTIDAGLVGSVDTAYVVPFAGVEAWSSTPIDPPEFSYGPPDDRHTDRLSQTYGVHATLGVEVRPGGPGGRASVLVGATLGALEDAHERDQYMGLAGGLRVKL